jgi:acetyl esterase/lipase
VTKSVVFMPGGLSKMGKYVVDVQEVEYLRHGDVPYLLKIHRPRGKGPFPAVLEAHGGAWAEGDRHNNDIVNSRVAAGGIVVAAVEFRNPPVATYPGSVQDLNFAIRWFKAHAREFATTPERIGAMGTSSGGHIAVLNALKPADPRYAAITAPGVGADASVPYVVAIWPVICPYGRAQYLKEKAEVDREYQGRGGALKLQTTYWLTEEAMAEGSPVLALERGDPVATPNILVVQNEIDELHPRKYLDQFVAGYRKRGGTVDVALYQGPSYDLLRRAPESSASLAGYERVITYIRDQAEKAARST